jgi:hypothetical protein
MNDATKSTSILIEKKETTFANISRDCKIKINKNQTSKPKEEETSKETRVLGKQREPFTNHDPPTILSR